MPLSTTTLHPVDECPDLMTDALVCDAQEMLIFASLWGRDTTIQQFIARLTLGHDADGLNQFHIVTAQGAAIPAVIGNIDRLEKRFTRVYRRTLFGSLVNLWLFDKRCIKPDKSNASALALLPQDSPHRLDRLWALVRDTCPLPLLDHWRDTVLELLQAHAMLMRLPSAFGPLEGHQLALDIPVLTTALGDLIRSGSLGVSPCVKAPDRTLRHVA